MEDTKDKSLVPKAPQDYLDIIYPFCFQYQVLLFYDDEMRLKYTVQWSLKIKDEILPILQ